MENKKLDYISILAGGGCKFDCSFCIGKDIRKNETPHYSSKFKSFIECFSDMTNLLSVSGDTSDPSFINATKTIPHIAKKYNKDIRVDIHTRNIEYVADAFNAGYDKFVFSIDEKFDIDILEKLLSSSFSEDNIRVSYVLLETNIDALERIIEMIYSKCNIQLTIRPEVHSKNKEVFVELFEKYKSNTKIWYWDYLIENEKHDVRYLFSNGLIASNCQWGKIAKIRP